MGSNRRSKIFEIEKEELQKIIDNSYAITDVLEKLHYDKYNGNYKTLLKRIDIDKLSLSKMKENGRLWRINFLKSIGKKNRVPVMEIFVTDSHHAGSVLKRVILREKLLEYVCQKCKNEGIWNDEKLSLQLDHINGTNTDNRLENLRFLCPNCHSQTHTFSGKRHKKEKIYETKEEKEKRIKENRRFEVSKEELEKLIFVDKIPFTKIGEMFGVSDNAIRKRCIRFGIDIKK